MDAINYTTPFWIENITGNTWTIYIDSITSGEYDMTWTISVEYSLNGTTWQTFGTTSTIKDSYISQQFSSSQRRVYLRCSTTHWGLFDIDLDRSYSYNIRSNYNMRIGGNIMSLLYGVDFVGKKTFPDDTIVGIFNGLFYGRTELTDVTDLVLPVTHTTSAIPQQGGANDSPGNRCYRSMFEGCTSLVNGPHIELRHRGTNDLAYCLQRMFYGCNSLKCYYTNLKSENYRYNSTAQGVASGGTCYNFSGALGSVAPASWTIKNITSFYLPTYDRVVEWKTSENENVDKVTDNNNVTIFEYFQDKTVPFYVQNITNSNETLSIKKSASSAPTLSIQYSRNRKDWTSMSSTSTTARTLTVQPGEKIYLRCNTNSWGNTSTASSRNSITGVSKVGGNIMSLLYGSSFTGNETSFPSGSSANFRYLLRENSNLLSAEDLILPATQLANACYGGMFNQCTNLLTAPKLPATVLIYDCYDGMFNTCSSLTVAPDLPATTLADRCYYGMFQSCTALTKTPYLPATTLATACYQVMFRYCSRLTNVSVLNAPTLVTDCYRGMFIGCTSLNYIKCLAISGIDSSSSVNVWTDNVAATGTFVKAAGSVWETGANGIPTGWTVVEE